MMKYFIAVITAIAWIASASAQETIIKAAKVYTQTGAPLSPGMVHVRDGKIIAVAKEIVAPSGAKVVDLGSGVLIPGLIDAHQTIGVEGGVAEQTSEVTPSFRVVDAIDWSSRSLRMARSEGTTTVCIVPGTENVVAGLSGIIKTASPPSKRIVKKDHALVIAECIDPASGNSARNRPDSIYTRHPTNRMGVTWILRSEFGRAKSNGSQANVPMRGALEGKRPVVCVARLDYDILAALRLKQEYPMTMTIAGGQEAYKVRDELVAAKVPVLLNRISTALGSGPEGSETIFNSAGLLHESKIPFAITGGQLLEQARFAVRFGLPADAALASITSVPAQLLGIENQVGVIAPDKDADLVALSGDPFELTSSVRWTMSDGVIRTEDQ